MPTPAPRTLPQAASDAFDLGFAVSGYIYDNLDKILYGAQDAPKW